MPPAALVKPDPKTPTKRSLINLIIDWIVYLNTLFNSSSSSQLVNGSFEKYTGSNNVPDGWDFTPYSGGSGAIDATTEGDGLNSFKIVVPGGGGNGGGYIQNHDLIPWSNLNAFYLKWFYKVSLATITNIVEVLWYDASGSFISSSTVWTASSGQSTSWAQNYGFVVSGSIPSNARFLRVRMTGGSVGSLAGNVWYDNVKIFMPKTYGQYSLFDASTGAFTWTAPEDCIGVISEQVSGGGGGSGASGGGGGGGYNKIYHPVIPGTTYTGHVGAGGAGAVGAASDGASSDFNGVGPAGGKGAPGGAGQGAGGIAVVKSLVAYPGPLIMASVNGAAGVAGVGGAATGINGYVPFLSTRGQGGSDTGASGSNGGQGSVILYY